MQDVRFSVIVPTRGRPTLARTLSSMLVHGLTDKDEVIVGADGPQPDARAIADRFITAMHLVYFETPPDHCWGTVPRNTAMAVARGTHLLFMDDDDEYINEALTVCRRKIATDLDKVHMFRMNQKYNWGIVWKTKDIREGNVGTPMFGVPNNKDRLGEWGRRYQNDLDFIQSTLEKYPRKALDVVWHEDVIAQCHVG